MSPAESKEKLVLAVTSNPVLAMNIPIPPMHPTRTAPCCVSRHSNAFFCNRMKNQIIIACGMSKNVYGKNQFHSKTRSFSGNVLVTMSTPTLSPTLSSISSSTSSIKDTQNSS